MTATTWMSTGFGWGWRRWAAIAAAVLLVVAGSVVALVQRDDGPALLGGDTASTAGESYSRDLASGGSSAPNTVQATKGVAEDAAASGDLIGPMPPETTPDGRVTLGGPSIVRTAQLSVRVRDGGLERALDQAMAAATATASGGFVVSSNTSSFQEGEAFGDLVVRVPAASFDAVRRQLRDLGEVESASQSGDDVSSQLVDLDARLRTVRAEEIALQAILSQARSVGDLLQVRDRLTGVRTEIEQLAAQQASLRDRVSYATINVSLHEGDVSGMPVPVDDEKGIVHSFRTAADATVAVVGGMVVVLGALLPFALLGLLAWLVIRRQSRRAARAGA